MNKISTDRLKVGMVTAKPIITKRGQQIAGTGTVLTSQLIARLSFYKITEIFIEDYTEPEETKEEPKEDVKSTPTSSEETTSVLAQVHSYSQKLKSTPKFQSFQNSYTQKIVSLQNQLQQLIEGSGTISAKDIIAGSEELFSSKTSLEIFDMVHTMRGTDDSVYAHSINVALISRAIGKWLHFSKDDLNELTLAGFLHDIGKVMIPDEVLNKQGKLTDEEFALIQGHAKQGYSILKKNGFGSRILLSALQHHERYDGSGYPRGLESDEIDYFASIIAIADVYDAMTAARSYRAPKCAFQVIAAFEEDGFQKYNPNVIYTFLERVAGCYNNSRVMLSNGMTGRVVFLNKNKLSRPIIETDDEDMFDLCSPSNKDVFIQAIL